MGIFREKLEKEKVWTEGMVQKVIISRFRNGMVYMVPNILVGCFEWDMMGIRRSGYAEEFEVKTTRADFMADKKKVIKHELYQRAFGGGELIMRQKYGTGVRRRVPNRFSYVVLDGLGIGVDDVPDWAGLFCVSRRGVKCVKSPPLIHKKKYEWEKKIAVSTSWRLIKAMGIGY